MKWTIQTIADFLGGQLSGNSQKTIHTFAHIQEATPDSITFLANPQYEKYLYTTQAGAVIINKNFQSTQPIAPTLIRVTDPYASLAILLQKYQTLTQPKKTGSESPVYLGKATTLGKNIYQGAFSYIGNHVNIGDAVQIYPQAYIGDHVTIGDHTIIYSGARIYAGTQIGSHCIIHAGAVIGSDGFGFAPQRDGHYEKIPQVGNVIIADHVEIGANTTIDRATMGHTRIQQGAKIDNLVQIAHNVTIGEHTVIAALSGIAGSATIGSHCQLGGQTGIAGHITVGPKTAIGGQAGVTRSHEKGHTILMGTPAFERQHYLKSYAWFKQLPKLAKKLMTINKQEEDQAAIEKGN